MGSAVPETASSICKTYSISFPLMNNKNKKNPKMMMTKKVAQMVEKRKGNSQNLKAMSCWILKMKAWDSEKIRGRH